jgi:murein DD-endopeptidase MepM/ murein hydrolase activator NlpD
VSILLLFIIIIAKSINISATNAITAQMRYVLNHNVELKSIHGYAQTMFLDIKKSIVPSSEGARDLERLTDAYTEQRTNSSEDSKNSSFLSKDAHISEDAHMSEDPHMPEDAHMSESQAGEHQKPETQIPERQMPELNPKTSVLAASSGEVDYGMIGPINGIFTTPFGEITGPAGIVRLHKGIDISVDETGDVKAVLDGIVTEFGSAPGYGNYVMLRHDNELATVYANCSSIAVVINDSVKRGEKIAMVGEDSMTGGSHLHFEIWHQGVPVDPIDYLIVTAG